MKIRAPFHFEPFSKKQRQILNWWTEDSPVKDMDGIIADGAIRSGKTVCMSLSFVLWAMTNYDGYEFGMAGKTIGSFRRNVLGPLTKMLVSRGIPFDYRRGDNQLIISYKGRTNKFHIFGGKDEGSQDLVQGVTLAGFLFDEVALMPQSFVNQATARCSVDGSKFWFNCNPEGPQHWFKKEWVDRVKEQGLLYLHFTMDDNLSLSEKIKTRYKNQYTGVFYDRYIRGLWTIAEGIIYDMFDRDRHVVRYEDIKDQITFKEDEIRRKQVAYVSCDYGTQNPCVFKMWEKGKDGIWYCTKEYYYSGRDKKKQKTDNEYVKDMLEFIGETKIRACIVDPSAASFIEALNQAGLPTRKAKNDVLDGIREVGVRLNQCSIKYVDTCEKTFEEYAQYAWDPKAGERGEDIPLKDHDHCMDADRYFIYTVLVKNKAKVKDKKRKGLM